MAFLTYPDSLNPKQWQKDKGKIAKLSGHTGIGDGLTRLRQAYERLEAIQSPNLQTINAPVTPALVDAAKELETAAEAFIAIATPVANDFKKDKLIPKDSVTAVVNRINDATRLLSGTTAFIEDAEECIDATKSLHDNPKKFLEASASTLVEMLGADVPKVFKISKKGETHGSPLLEFAESSETASAFVRKGPVNNVLQIVPILTRSPPRMTILPFQDNAGTFTILSKKALYCFTGPLSGCNIYVAVHADKEPLFMHTNANKDSGNVAKNIAAKDDIANAIIALHPGYDLKHRLVRQTYEIPAFVFGVRTGSGWKFYSHQLNGTGGMRVVKKAEPLPTV